MTPEQLPHEKHTTEYLANERTFLAWVRTSIAVLSLGFVIAKFSVWITTPQQRNGHAYRHDHDGFWWSDNGIGRLALLPGE